MQKPHYQDKDFDSLFRNLYPKLVKFACRFVINKPAAQDIVTESFIKLWNLREDFASDLKRTAFLYITTRNACFNYLEHVKMRNRVNVEIRHASKKYENAIYEEIISVEILEEVHKQLKNLPPRCSKVLTLYFRKGMSNREIAVSLKISGLTARNHRMRGLQKLREKIKSDSSNFI